MPNGAFSLLLRSAVSRAKLVIHGASRPPLQTSTGGADRDQERRDEGEATEKGGAAVASDTSAGSGGRAQQIEAGNR